MFKEEFLGRIIQEQAIREDESNCMLFWEEQYDTFMEDKKEKRLII